MNHVTHTLDVTHTLVMASDFMSGIGLWFDNPPALIIDVLNSDIEY